MNTNLAIEIFKQATLETTVGACEKCPRKDKNKTCIGCLDNAKEQVLLEIERLKERIEDLNTINEEHQILNGMIRKELQQKENIIKEVREYIKQTGQYLEDIKRFKVDVLEPDYLNILEILDKGETGCMNS